MMVDLLFVSLGLCCHIGKAPPGLSTYQMVVNDERDDGEEEREWRPELCPQERLSETEWHSDDEEADVNDGDDGGEQLHD